MHATRTTDECNFLISPNIPCGPCKSCREQQWKPQPGERVLVEAMVNQACPQIGGRILYELDINENDVWLYVPLSSLRPLPVQGEGVGK